MRAKDNAHPHQFGVSPVGISRYFALYITQIGWLSLGAYLLSNAYWPSTCKPDTLSKIYSCSFRLADNHGWVETVLMTWLWSTPLLIALEISRRFQKQERR